jgi:hypothetical protein
MHGSPRPEPDHEPDVLNIMLVVLTSMKHLLSGVLIEDEPRRRFSQFPGGVSDDRCFASAVALSWRCLTRRVSSGVL